MNKQIKFIYKIFIKNSIGKVLSFFIKRDEKIFILNSKTNKDSFLHNTKYLFIYLSRYKNCNTFWLVDKKSSLKTFRKYGYQNVYIRNSLKGVYYTLLAKYWLYDFSPNSISNYFSNNAVCINLWHGIPLKKIENDGQTTLQNKLNKIQKIMYNFFKTKDNYYVVNSNYEQSCYETAFQTTKEKIKILGSPRLDVLLHDIPNAEMFMEKDFNNIKNFKTQGKKIFIYMPTFRDTGKDISGWLKSDKLKEFLHNNNAILVCKLHPFDKNSLDFELSEDFYKMDSDSDVYPILKYTDALITDYSSVAFDYLLLDKPIIYHVPDLQEYQETCRGFYMLYEEFAVGERTENNSEIINAMQNVIDGVDNYKEQRKSLKDRMFKYQDGRNCERVVEWIKSLDEKKKK